MNVFEAVRSWTLFTYVNVNVIDSNIVSWWKTEHSHILMRMRTAATIDKKVPHPREDAWRLISENVWTKNHSNLVLESLRFGWIHA